MAQAGAGWIRINFRLGIGSFLDWTETITYGYSALSLYDTIVDTARSHGLKVLGELSNEAWNGYLADWQANNAEVAGGTGDNPYLQAFSQRAAMTLAQHFVGMPRLPQQRSEPHSSIYATHMYKVTGALA